MYWKDAKEIICSRISCKEYLRKSKHGNYICAFCHSGEGPNGTGAVKFYENTNSTYCHICERYANVIDLYMQHNGATFPEAVEALAPKAGIREEIEGLEDRPAGESFKPAPSEPSSFSGETPSFDEAPPAVLVEEPKDYREYYKVCAERLRESPDALGYLEKRGISYQTARRAFLGFDPAADPANVPGAMGHEYRPHPCPRIILPTKKSQYVGRSIDPATEDAYKKSNSKGSSPGIFNEAVLYGETVFVTEGAFDALSIMEVGQAAIALNSTSNAKKILLAQLEKNPTKGTLILCLDNDKAGKEATQILRDGLQRLNISFLVADICCGYKDPNEALVADREKFAAAVATAAGQTAARPDIIRRYLDELMAGEIEKFRGYDIKTGFSTLDAKIDVLYPGLYMLAATTSLGKTTFALQMADNIAASGQDVVYFSLEQSRFEMVSKSLARLTAQANIKNSITALSIRRGFLPGNVLDAIGKYRANIADRLSIVEGNFNCDIGYIADYARRYISKTGKKPVLFIDYLQILQPAAAGKSRNTKKDEVDLAVTELKRLSRELDLVIILISSVNRANYTGKFKLESLKESGGIEYTADVVWGLQFSCLDEAVFYKKDANTEKEDRIKKAETENPRSIKFVCLKNRYGVKNFYLDFLYYPACDLFIPTAAAAKGAKSA